MTDETKDFTGWAVLEIMGHAQFAGYVSTQPLAGHSMVRIDVPEVTRQWDGKKIPPFTKLFGASSVYSLTPVSEDLARLSAQQFETRPITVVDLSRPMHSQPKLIEEPKAAAFDDDDVEF